MNERRDYERVPFHCRTTLLPWPGGNPVEAWAMDLSLGGVQLASERALPARQVVTVTFHLRDEHQREVDEQARGLIMRQRFEIEGYIYGVEFVEILDGSRQPFLLQKLGLASEHGAVVGAVSWLRQEVIDMMLGCSYARWDGTGGDVF